MIVSVATVGMGRQGLVGAVVVEGQAARGKDNAAQQGVRMIAGDGICPQQRQAGALVEDNNYLPRTPAEGRRREGLDGRPTIGDDG